ncbi:MAG TPA: hypothetical protein VGL91_02865 [Acidobacteriota bacterium]|jgi:hypothetical protein
MEPSRFGGGGETSVHPAIACAVLLAGVLILFLPRKYLVLPFFSAVFLIPMDQVLVVGPLHFQMLRVVVLFGWVRLLAIKFSTKIEFLNGGMKGIDKAVALLGIFTAIDFVFLWQEWGALINQMGALYMMFGIYFLLRFMIRDEEDVDRALRALVYIAAVIALVMVIEQSTGRNPYVLFGGTHQAMRESLEAREDRFRAMASFAHPILAGSFGATSLPLFLGLWWKGKNRAGALVGAIAATVITFASVSSTPLLAYGAGIFALFLWPLRKRMRIIRWGIVISLLCLHLSMKAPVWALIGRFDVVGGSSGYHRFYLVDRFIRHFGDWWLLGVKNNGQWGWDMWDLANQYVAVGETSGLLPLIFFISIIVCGFQYLGNARKACEGNKRKEFFLWTLGAALFANIVAFFGISYFDQTMVAWYAFLAMISAVANDAMRSLELEQAGDLKDGKSPLLPQIASCYSSNSLASSRFP